MDLETLQGQIIDRVESYGVNRKAAIQDAIEGGRLLFMARGRLNHGVADWGAEPHPPA